MKKIILISTLSMFLIGCYTNPVTTDNINTESNTTINDNGTEIITGEITDSLYTSFSGINVINFNLTNTITDSTIIQISIKQLEQGSWIDINALDIFWTYTNNTITIYKNINLIGFYKITIINPLGIYQSIILDIQQSNKGI